jgi:hypothetical protein
MVEGSTPAHPSELEPILRRMETVMKDGNVLVHCRGGLGRAGVVACCYLLRSGLLKPKRSESGGGRSGLLYDPEKALGQLVAQTQAALASHKTFVPVVGSVSVVNDGDEDEDTCADGDQGGRSRLSTKELRSTKGELERHGIAREGCPKEAGNLQGNQRNNEGREESGRRIILNVEETEASRRAIQYVRLRRSHKAIETRRQEDFISEYARWMSGAHGPAAKC